MVFSTIVLRTLTLARRQFCIMSKPNVVFVLGGPGAGKGTQCTKIVEKFGYVHLSAGDLLRQERQKPDSPVGQLIEEHIRNGSIVPVEITCSLLEQAMNEATERDNKHNFLIDGFPRNKDNLDGWQKQMGDKAVVKHVLFFDCPDELCVERVLERGRGGSGRSDDNEASLKKRLVTYHDSTRPIIEYYKELNLVQKINAGRTVDEVFDDVARLF